MKGAKQKEPTWTALVLATLRAQEDFLDIRMLMAHTGGSYNQVNAACHHLRSKRAVDVVVEKDGHGWWFALPEEQDTRSKRVDERTPETKPRKLRHYRTYKTSQE